DYARANPGKISFASSGKGAAAHLTTELLKEVTKTDMVHVPYKGAAPALTDLIGGQVELFFDAASGLIQAGKTGRVRLIGVASDKRLPVLPDVPTFEEQGIDNFTGSTWAGMLAPAGTPPDIVKRMADEITAIVNLPDVRQRFEELGTFPAGGTPEEFGKFIADETKKWGDVIRTANVTVD
ncbi:MAG: tripartite tricarboxylate transporter substrate-binding protein, partial [Gammaproteobacteria bacterium]